MSGWIYMKTGDTEPPVDGQLCDRNGPVNLTGCTITFIMKSPTGTMKVNSPMVIVDAVDARVRYYWGPTDTDTPDAYLCEIEVSFPGGSIATWPNGPYDKYIPGIIIEDLN